MHTVAKNNILISERKRFKGNKKPEESHILLLLLLPKSVMTTNNIATRKESQMTLPRFSVPVPLAKNQWYQGSAQSVTS